MYNNIQNYIKHPKLPPNKLYYLECKRTVYLSCISSTAFIKISTNNKYAKES